MRVNPGADVRDTSVMSGCCDPRGCNDMFGPRFSRHLRSRYRKRGLDKTATRIVDFQFNPHPVAAERVFVFVGVSRARAVSAMERLLVVLEHMILVDVFPVIQTHNACCILKSVMTGCVSSASRYDC